LWSKKHPLLDYSNVNNQRLLSNGSVNTFPWAPNHVTTATYMHPTREELLEAAFSMWSFPRLYTGDQNGTAESQFGEERLSSEWTEMTGILIQDFRE
jgi:hypothetical protein